jgi:large repetitive protein
VPARVAGLVAIVVALLAQSVVAAHAAPPLVLQYHLDETNPAADANKTAADSSGNGVNATSTYNFSPVAAGKFGGALGAPGDYRTTPSPTADALTSPAHLTVLAWIKQTGDPGQLRYIAGRGNDGTTCTGGSFGLYNGFTGTSNPHPGPRFWIKTNTTVNGNGSVWSNTPSDPNTVLYDGQWHLVAGTFDGTAVRLFIDGVQQGADVNVPTGAVINYAIPGQTSTYFFMKAYPVGACSPVPFPGPIDEARLYDRALTATELGRMAAAPDGGSPPDLIPDSSSGPPSGGGPSPGPAGTPPGTAVKKKCKKRKKHRSAGAAKKKKCTKKKHQSA